MKPKEANTFAQRLKGLLPKMTDEQVLFWAGRFERFETAAADAAICRYAEESDELSTPRLLSLLREETIRLTPAQQSTEADDAERDWSAVRDAITAMSDEEIAARRANVLASASEFLLRHIGTADPRSNRTLMALIFAGNSGGPGV